MTRQKLTVLATAIVTLGAFASAQENKPTAAPAPTVNEAPRVPSVVPADATGLAIDPNSYIIGPEDILKISIWRDPELSGAVAVRPDGKITRPLIGDVQASGLTPTRLTSTLKEAYADKLRSPEITIEVIQVNSKRYSITGGVNRPGTFPLVVPLRVFEAFNMSGGFKEFAKKTDIIILRADGSRLKFNYEAFVKGKKGAADQNVFLLNGDTIIVKE